MKIQTLFNRCLEEEERKSGHSITLQEISDVTLLKVDVLKLIKTSHYHDISILAIGDLLTIANYFKIKFHDFIIIEEDIQISTEANEDNNELTKQILSPSYCRTGDEFKRSLSNSKNYNIYEAVPTLIDSLSDLIDRNNGIILAGVSSNINIKYRTNDVLVRFFAKDNQIIIKDILFGKSIALDHRELFKEIYKKYFFKTNKYSVQTAADVAILISLIEGMSIV
ncbi:hypothetical protein K9O30_06305 [Clostridium bowmanii]|uniref:hypothetical protein n=1 Tax=Clostridium bowmanii TaxID=132925 RepID=UPI001C0C60A3|nr:hypothetical protein [Clostridium bowmanii]MBU3188772.1 hypothetical protein [Clostridium bowmanii]MCA1073356.1 hypothetical protein [Clostridium bowmanii]